MAEDVRAALDENTRRYYLDAMGIQCWQQIDSEGDSLRQVIAPVDETMAGSDRDVAVESCTSLEELVQLCTHCQLYKTRKQALTGRGNQSAELMFIVLSPAAADDESGILCGAEANVLFSKMLAAIDISIDDVYITSLLKCVVPAGHTVLPEEIQSCNNYLIQQIQLIQPKLLVVLGGTAASCLLQKDLSIDDFREMNDGAVHRLESLPLFFSYSPQELLQQPENKRKAWSDLQQLQKIMDSLK